MVNLQQVRDDTLCAATGVLYKSLYVVLVGAYRGVRGLSTADAPWFENAGREFRLYMRSAKVGAGRI